jgi:hypothetical protein
VLRENVTSEYVLQIKIAGNHGRTLCRLCPTWESTPFKKPVQINRMAEGVVRIKVYGRRDAAVPFAASLLVLLLCVNVGLTSFRSLVWIAFIIWAAFTAFIAANFWESRFILVDKEKKEFSLRRKRVATSDIKSIGRTDVSGYADLISFRRVKLKICMRDGRVLYFPSSLTPSIADRADRLVAELSKHAKTTGKR